jgi:hypothetical protein
LRVRHHPRSRALGQHRDRHVARPASSNAWPHHLDESAIYPFFAERRKEGVERAVLRLKWHRSWGGIAKNSACCQRSWSAQPRAPASCRSMRVARSLRRLDFRKLTASSCLRVVHLARCFAPGEGPSAATGPADQARIIQRRSPRPYGPWKVATFSQVPVSHYRAVWSTLAEASQRPSGEKATMGTCPWWPSSAWTIRPVSTSPAPAAPARTWPRPGWYPSPAR